MTTSFSRRPASRRNAPLSERDILAEVEAIVQAVDQGDRHAALEELADAARQAMDQYSAISRQINEARRTLKALADTAEADMDPTLQTGLLGIQLLAFLMSQGNVALHVQGLVPSMERLDKATIAWKATLTRDGGRDA